METSFDKFFKKLIESSDLKSKKEISIDELRIIMKQINEYFYTTYKDIGQVKALDSEFDYFSDFHKFWEKNHLQILEPKINETQCKKVADILNDIFIRTDSKAFYELYETYNLNPDEVCRVRYFSANQDFRGSRDFEDLSKKFIDDPTIFDKEKIFSSPEDFLKQIGITGLSQNDKRLKYALTASKMLIDKNIEPF
ncbi:MAG: hypothetical protein PHW02_02935, partial [bacterium]|nr:hypothetical protein [bacterium]